jgi:hypothetical protein
MTRTRRYVHGKALNADISGTGELLTLQTADRDRVTLSIEADVASDFALDVQFAESEDFVQDWATYSSDSVQDVRDLTVYAVRIRNTTGQSSGNTADVRVGAE